LCDSWRRCQSRNEGMSDSLMKFISNGLMLKIVQVEWIQLE